MPLLAAVVIVSLGVGIGANTIVFSWIQAVVFKPTPGGSRRRGAFTLSSPVPTPASTPRPRGPSIRDLRDRLRTIDSLIAFRMAPLYVGESGHVERGNGLLVSSNYFSALGLTPALGRFLRAEETDTQERRRSS